MGGVIIRNDELRRGLPPVCVKTGEPTTMVRRHMLFQREHASWWWWFWLGWAAWIFRTALGDRMVQVRLPVAPRVKVRHDVLRALRLCAVLVLVVLWPRPDTWTTPRGLLVMGATVVAFAVLHRYTRAAWVRPRLVADGVRVEAHRAFVEALRPSARPWTQRLVDPVGAAPAAGWYPDPAGTTALRWWDGAAWTEHLHERVNG